LAKKKLITCALTVFCLTLIGFSAGAQNAKAQQLACIIGPPPSTPTILINSQVQLEVKISGGWGNYSYQWYANDTAIVNATSSTLTFKVTQIGSYNIKCDVTDATGTISNPATSNIINYKVVSDTGAVIPGVQGSGPQSSDNQRLAEIVIIAVAVVVIVIAIAATAIVMKQRNSKKTKNP